MALAGLILAIIALMLWAFTVGAAIYLHWRFVLSPWRVMRRDVAAMAEKFATYDFQIKTLEDASRTSRVIAMSDSEQARKERNARFETANRGA